MPEKCVVFGCSNERKKEKGSQLRPTPFYGSKDPQKQKRRRKWVYFVKLKRAHWCALMISKMNITRTGLLV